MENKRLALKVVLMGEGATFAFGAGYGAGLIPEHAPLLGMAVPFIAVGMSWLNFNMHDQRNWTAASLAAVTFMGVLASTVLVPTAMLGAEVGSHFNPRSAVSVAPR